MSIILALALPISLLAAATTGWLTRTAARRADRRERRQTAAAAAADLHQAGQPRTIEQVIERDGLSAATEMAIHRGRSWVRQLELDGADLQAEADRLQQGFDDGPKDIIERQGTLPRVVLLWICTVLFVAVTVLLFLLVHGVLLVLLNGNDKVATPLALVDVIFAAALGILIHEALSPSGAIPAWDGTPFADRAPSAVGLVSLLGFFLAISVILAPARADELHAVKVSQARQSCADARAAAQDDDAAATAGETVACDRASTMQANLERARLWDRAAAVMLPLAEIVLGAFAIDLVILQGARRARRRVDRAKEDVEANRRAVAAATDLVIDDLVEEAVRAGFTVTDVNTHLASAGISPPDRPAPPEPGPTPQDDPPPHPEPTPDDLRQAPLGDYRAPEGDAGGPDDPVIDREPIRHDQETPDPAPAGAGVPHAV